MELERNAEHGIVVSGLVRWGLTFTLPYTAGYEPRARTLRVPRRPAGPFAGAVVFIVRILVGISVPLALRRALPEALQQRESGVVDGEG